MPEEAAESTAGGDRNPFTDAEQLEYIPAENVDDRVVGRAETVIPAAGTVTIDVDAQRLAEIVLNTLPEDGEYDDVWLHAPEDGALTLTDHLKPAGPDEGDEPPTEVTYTSVVDWGDDRPNQAIVGIEYLGRAVAVLGADDLDELTLYMDDSGLLAFEPPQGHGHTVIIAPKQTPEHPEVSKSTIAEEREKMEEVSS